MAGTTFCPSEFIFTVEEGLAILKVMATAKQKRIDRPQPAKKAVKRAQASSPASPEARLEAAHAKFTKTPKGSPEHDRAWEELTDALFANAK